MQLTQEKELLSRGSLWRALLLPLIMLGLFLLGRALGLGTGLGEARAWIAENAFLGGLLFLGMFVLTALALLPGLPLTLAAGAVFGSVLGVLWVSLGSLLGATIAFLLARFLAREMIARRLRRHAVFCRVERLTDEQGPVICALTRLFPIFPYSILNYAFGLTRISFPTYVLWTWLCMLPGTIIFVSGTDALLKAIELGEVSWTLILVTGLNVGLLLALIPWARGHLKRSGPKSGKDSIDS